MINEERGLAGGQGIPNGQWAVTHEEALRRAHSKLEGGCTVIIDDTTSLLLLRDAWRALAARLSAPFLLIYVDTADELITYRVLANRRHPNRPDVTDAVMIDHVATFEPPPATERHLVTGSRTQDVPVLLTAIRKGTCAMSLPGDRIAQISTTANIRGQGLSKPSSAGLLTEDR